MRPNLLHLIMVTSWLFVDSQANGAPRHARKDDVQIKCWRALASRPPNRNYSCRVDVLDVADRDRWLLYPDPFEERLKPIEPVVFIEADQRDEGLVIFGEVESDDGFRAILVPAHQRLHVKELVLWTMEKAEDITVWIGDELPLSNGESLGAVFKRATTDYIAPGSTHPGEWKAPKGTTVAFDPKGFKTIRLAPLPKRKK